MYIDNYIFVVIDELLVTSAPISSETVLKQNITFTGNSVPAHQKSHRFLAARINSECSVEWFLLSFRINGNTSWTICSSNGTGFCAIPNSLEGVKQCSEP